MQPTWTLHMYATALQAMARAYEADAVAAGKHEPRPDWPEWHTNVFNVLDDLARRIFAVIEADGNYDVSPSRYNEVQRIADSVAAAGAWLENLNRDTFGLYLALEAMEEPLNFVAEEMKRQHDALRRAA